MSSSNKKKGSAFERQAGKLLGASRTPLSGAIGGGDLTGGLLERHGLMAECKVRKRLSWTVIRKAVDQALAALGSGGFRYPLAIVKEDYGKPYACMYLEDFVALLSGSQESGAYHVRARCRSIRKLADEIEELSQ